METSRNLVKEMSFSADNISNGFYADSDCKNFGPNEELYGTLPSALHFTSDTKEFKAKRKKIKHLLSQQPISRDELKCLAISEGGLVDDDIRKEAWPLLLGLSEFTDPPAPSEDELKAHPEYQQVVLDVNRSLKRFPPGIPLEQRLSLQNQLTRLILRVVMAHPRLRYYQGYHDVAVTLLLVTGENVSFFLLEYLSMHHLKDCMEPTLEKTSYLLNYIYPLLRHQNRAVHDHLNKSEVGTMFALPWFLTWFGHSLNHYKDVVRLYDYFLASEPLAPLYLSAVIVVYRSKEILETPCDMAYLHAVLSTLSDDLPFEHLLKKATKLYKKYPPKVIEGEVRQRVEEEQRMRAMEMAVRQARMARNRPHGSFVWRWLGRIDPIRRFPLWGFPQPNNIPQAFRRYRYVMATAFAFGVYAVYMQALEGR